MTVRRQARGRARIESILDAAEELIAGSGYDDMTTNQVAARAGISPGSLYQYFGNKAELLDGLLDRYQVQMDGFWAEQLGGEAEQLPIDTLVDRVIDAVLAFKADRPAIWILFHGSATSEVLARAAGCLDGQLADRLAHLYATRAPHLPPDRRRLVAEVTVATVKSLLPLVMAPTRGTSADAATTELKRVLSGYLIPALAPPP